MKIYITGHTSGLGKKLYEFYLDQKYEVIGFSKSNGYDLEKNFQEIITQIDSNSIFINNSYANGIQKRFIAELHGKIDKMIVCGSIASIFPDPKMPEYSNDKLQLEDVFYSYSNKKSKTQYLLLDLTSSSYKDSDLILKSIQFWILNPNVIRIGFNIDE